jgi:hypothetical protein
MQAMLAALAMSLSLFATADAGQPSPSEKLLAHTGLAQQARLLHSLVSEAAIDNRTRCGLDNQTVPALAATRYDASSLLADASRQMQRQITSTAAEHLLSWFESAAGQRIAELEKNDPLATEPSARTRALIAELANNRSNTTDPRAQAILDIVKHTRVARFTALLGSEIEYAGAIASGCLTRADIDGKARLIEQVRADAIRTDYALLQQIVAFEAPMEMALVFQPLSDLQLLAYRDFTQHALSRHFYRTLTDAFIGSFQSASDHLRHTTNAADPVTASNQD